MYTIKRPSCSLEALGIYVSLVGVQICSAVVGVLMGKELSRGASPLAFIVYSNGVGGLVLIPFAFFFEKKNRPTTVSLTLLGQFFMLSLGGVCGFQAFLLMGLRDTSPAFASAMPNLAPVLIFILAWALGMEKVDIMCIPIRAKILGTVICVGGAMAMSFLQGPTLAQLWPLWGQSTSVSNTNTVYLVENILHEGDSGNQIRGCIYLISAVIMLSTTMILQVETLKKFPATLSLTSITAILGSIQTAVLITILDRGIIPTSWILDRAGILTVLAAGIIFNAMAFPLQLWCLQKRGPVFVTVFSPVSTVCSAILSSIVLGDTLRLGLGRWVIRYILKYSTWSAILSSILLGDTLRLGSLMGVILIFIGLYLFLWGKSQDDATQITISSDEKADITIAAEGEENQHPPPASEIVDVKTPLLH